MTSLHTALDIAKCVRQGEYDQPMFDCKPHEAYETLKVLRDEVLRLTTEIARLRALLAYRSVTHD